MKAKLIVDMTGPNPEYDRDLAAACAVDGKPYGVPHSIPKPAGTVIDDPKCYLLVRQGVAMPADDECKIMAGVDCEPAAVQDRLSRYKDLEKGMATKDKSIDAPEKTEVSE